jgi:hypothetical protein
MRSSLKVLLVGSVLVAGSVMAQVNRGSALANPLFPRNNWWNTDVSKAPLDPNAASYLSFIGGEPMHPDFGGDTYVTGNEIYGMVYIDVPGTQPLVPMVFDIPGENDFGAPGRPAGYPIPTEAITQAHWVEGGEPCNSGVGGDRHMLIVDRDHNFLFETWATRYNTALTRWEAGSGAVFSLTSNARRPEEWTSADAAGLAILPGLVRYDEVYGSAPIKHALRFTVNDTNGYVFPGSHVAGSGSGAPPMGMRMRLKESVVITGYSAPMQRVLQAMKTYGLIVADNGTDMYISGAYDSRWDDDLLVETFDDFHASDFEVILLGWRPIADFNIDGKLDVVWRNNANGSNAIWRMNGTSFAGITDLPALPNTAYKFSGAADFDRDGKTDLLLRNQTTGANAVWRMNGTSLAGISDLPALPVTAYEFCGTADFDGDGYVDILLRNNTTGQNAIWLLTGTSLKGIVDLPALPNSNYRFVGAADFNFDGFPDVVIRNIVDGRNALWLLNGTSLTGIVDLPALPNTAYVIGAVGDLNLDNNPDILLRNETTGQNAAWLMQGTSLLQIIDLPALPTTTWKMSGPR